MFKTSLKSVLVASSVAIAAVSTVHAQEGWKNESQVGIVTTSGNTDTSTLSASQITTYNFSKNVVRFTAGYLYQETSDVVSAKAWNLGLRYERELSERFSIFAAETVLSDKFKDLRQGYNTDVGAKYFFSKDDTLTWFGEAGYRFTRQNATIANTNLHFARLYTEIEKKFSDTVSVKYWVEFLPNFTISEDWQANSELSLSAALSKVFSVKSAYLLKFDHLPNAAGLKPADKVLTTSLVAKF
jgi:putative salt-induced outer membrane protein